MSHVITTTSTSTIPGYPWQDGAVPARQQYEEDLKRRQKEHLDAVNGNIPRRPCLHDQCPSCHGTGVKLDGSACIHEISCPCPKCSPTC